MHPDFLKAIDDLREVCGFPFVLTSAYRAKTHPAERNKPNPGMHTKGLAADIKCTGSYERYKILKHALAAGFTGIGIGKDFIHLDILTLLGWSKAGCRYMKSANYLDIPQLQ